MAEGNLEAGETTTVTLDARAELVIVSAAGGELWVTTDGSNPDWPKAGTVRVIPARSPQAIPVLGPDDPTIVKLRSPKGADYTVEAGTQTDADSAPGMGAAGQSGASALADSHLYIFHDVATVLPGDGSGTPVVMDLLDDPPGIVGTAMSHDGVGIVIEEDGVYSFTGSVRFPDATDATRRAAEIRCSPSPPETGQVQMPALNGGDTEIVVTLSAIDLVAGATVQIHAGQNSDDPMNAGYSWLYGKRIA